MKIYNARICSRAQKLSAISDLIQRVSHIESELFNVYRDPMLYIMPEKAKGRVMDYFIKVVVGDEKGK